MPTTPRQVNHRPDQMSFDWSKPSNSVPANDAHETAPVTIAPSELVLERSSPQSGPLRLSPGAAAIIHGHLPPPTLEQYLKVADIDETTRMSLDTLAAAVGHQSPSVQRLPWDFRTSFPEPLEEAIEAGKLHEHDLHPDNLKALHDEHARHALTLVAQLDAVMDARRKSVDPHTGRAPRTAKQRENLEKLLRYEPPRLERSFEVLMDVYEEAFGGEAADAFRKAIRAWHAGLEVASERPPQAPPLQSSIGEGVFGRGDDGTVVRPSSDEIASITDEVTEQLIPLPDGAERQALLARYAQDFGMDAARDLDLWCRGNSRIEPRQPFAYDRSHPWHYYHEGDGAVPVPLKAIPARPTSVDDLGVKWPRNPGKRRERIEQTFAAHLDQLADDEKRYAELIESGIDALSSYDRLIAHRGNDDLALASAIALSYTHVSGTRGCIECLKRELSPGGTRQEPD